MAASNGSLDDDVDIEDELSPELSDQLGELLLGAAQQFNVDNPNVGLNFLHVFGGDNDFGFNPGDEEMVDLFDDDSDMDSYFEEDCVQQIFTSLGDSHVIRRLSYHKNGSHFLLPRVVSSSEYCYEELYRLLEELELLCKVWRRRVEHPYTAHMEGEAGGDWLREGEDYSSSDYEYDSEEEDYLKNITPGQVNESLTKKKYCQSAKVFYQVFTAINQFESFLRFVSKTKKYIFKVIFGVFLETLPTDTRFKIPEELWEKVWKFSQNAHFRFRSQETICVDDNYYKAGLRSTTRNVGLRNTEIERINEAFGALGNLHMLVFEILYKNPHLTEPSALLELEVGDLSDKFVVGVWKEAAQAARTAVIKLQQLDSFLAAHTDTADLKEGSGKKTKPGNLELPAHLETGCISVEDVQIQVDHSVLKLDPAASIIVSESICPYICISSSYLMEDDRLGLMLVVIDVDNSCKVVHKIRTPIRYENHLIEVGSQSVIRKNECGWKKYFYLSPDRLSFLSRATSSSASRAGEDEVKVFTVSLGGETCDLTVEQNLFSSRVGGSSSEFRHSTAVFVSHSASGVLLLHQSPFQLNTRLSLHCPTSGEPLLSLSWQEDVSLLSSSCPTRVLLRTASTASVLLFSLQSGETLHSWRKSDLNRQFNTPSETSWSAVFDCSPSRSQILLHTKTLSGFSLVQFNPHNEMAGLTPVLTGSMAEAINGLGASCRLLEGVLLTNTKSQIPAMDGGYVRSHQVSGYNLASKTKHNLLCMVADHLKEDASILNMITRKWRDEANNIQRWDPDRRPVFVINKTKVGVLLESGKVVRIIDFGLTAAEMISSETNGDSRKQQEECRKRKLEINKELFLQGDVHTGVIVEWKGNHGFMKSNGAAKPLGKIFIHQDDVEEEQDTRNMMKKGRKVEFKIDFNPGDDESYKARVLSCID